MDATPTQQQILDFLKTNEPFDILNAQQRQALLQLCELRTLAEGDRIFEMGQPANFMYIMLRGKVDVHLPMGGQIRHAVTHIPGSVSGVFPFSRMETSPGYGVARESCAVLCLHKDYFKDLINISYELMQGLVHMMMDRVRETTRQQDHNEKLVSLGKLSAGLAHELNNPASALQRSAIELRNNLHTTPEKFKQVISMKLEPAQVDEVNTLVFSKLENPPRDRLPLLQRSEQEDSLSDWLEDQGLEDGIEWAEFLVEFGFDYEDLEEFAEILEKEALLPVLAWVVNLLRNERLLKEMEEASTRIADLVSSIKSYTHMDQARDFQSVDVRQGLRNTLKILNHKIRHRQVQVETHFSDDLPEVPGMPGELNQIWTNLLDNALDAVAEKQGRIEIRAEKEAPWVVVYIRDNGPGIPEDIRNSIFDPFFTTKPIGQGTGLGLDTVQRIIRTHQGDIRLESQPGQTEFRICLPLQRN